MLDNAVPFIIYRSKDAIKVAWGAEKQVDVDFFPLTSNCYIGVDVNSYAVSVTLTSLAEQQIFDIFGF